MIFRCKTLWVVLLMVACSPVLSEVHFPHLVHGWETSTAGEIPNHFLSLSNIQIGRSTIDDVYDELGKTVAYRPGSESYSPKLICYLSSTDDTAVVFQSGPLGGWSVITAIWVGRARHVDTAKCSTSDKIDRTRANIGGIFIGTNTLTIKGELGEPTYVEPPHVAYRFETRDETSSETVFDIVSGLEIELEDDCVVWYRVYWQAST